MGWKLRGKKLAHTVETFHEEKKGGTFSRDDVKRPGILQCPLDSTAPEFFCVLVFELLDALSSFNLLHPNS